MQTGREILLKGYSPDEILKMTDKELNLFVFVNEPIVFATGTAQILGNFRLKPDTFVIELAQIEGGGEGVLSTLWALTEKYARKRGLRKVEWIVYAINCARPNLKLKRILEKRVL